MAKSAPQSIEKSLDEFINLAPSLDRRHPAVGNRIEAIVRPGDLPEHRPDGIRALPSPPVQLCGGVGTTSEVFPLALTHFQKRVLRRRELATEARDVGRADG